MNENSELHILRIRSQSQTSLALGWGLTAFVSFLCVVLAVASTRFVGPFASLFAGLDVDLPWPTRFLIATHSWLLSTYFLVLAVLALGKEWLSRDFRLKRLITVRIFLAALISAGIVLLLLYLPVLTIASKLRDAN